MLPIIMDISNEEQRLFVEDMYEKYSKKMYSAACQILNHHEDAEDCVHDVIVMIVEHIERFEMLKGADLKRLLIIYARNAAINKYNCKKRRRIVSLTISSDDENDRGEIDIPDSDEDLENFFVNSEKANYVRELVEKLSDHYRDVISLRYFYYMDFEEISKIIRVSEATLRMRVTRAKRKIIEMGGERLNDYRKTR